MERQTGSTRLTGSPQDQGGEDDLLRAVKEAAAAEFEILGEMGRGERRSVVYLSRERASQKLVALKLRPEGGEYELSVLRELDASVPGMSNTCPACHKDIVGWGRFCSHCGRDLSSTRESASSPEQQLQAVKRAAEGEYDVLGEMHHAEGGDVVYFARELGSGRLVALRLIREEHGDGTESFALDVTQVIKPLVASLGATYASPSSAKQAASAPPARAAAPSPRSPQPVARSATPPSVIVPDDLMQEGERSAPQKRLPIVPIGIAAAVLVVAGTLFVFSGSRHGASGSATEPATNVIVPVAPPADPPPVATAKVDSGAIAIGSLPRGARVTVNGESVSERQLSVLPGTYQLAASAPGYRNVSERVEVIAGQTFEWAPEMQSTKSAARPRAAKAAQPTKVVAQAANCFNAYSEKNWTVAAVTCTREANAGSQPAQRNLGTMYDQGLGVARNPAQAAIWFRKAAETGNRDATFQLATMYENGRGVPQDQKQAIDWYRKAGLLGDADSQVKLGRAYMDGKGATRNEGEAAEWFQRAAAQGDLYALNRLGGMYAEGKGVQKDEARSVKLFQTAAARGDAQAQFNLATMYAKGRGAQRSDSAANDLYIKSAKQGYGDAIREAQRRHLKF
jgi:TPR repeat protein